MFLKLEDSISITNYNEDHPFYRLRPIDYIEINSLSISENIEAVRVLSAFIKALLKERDLILKETKRRFDFIHDITSINLDDFISIEENKNLKS